MLIYFLAESQDYLNTTTNILEQSSIESGQIKKHSDIYNFMKIITFENNNFCGCLGDITLLCHS